MPWRCPDCSRTNDPEKRTCECGYSCFDVLGIKDDTPGDAVEQTYRYLLKVWKTSFESPDPRSRSKAGERLKKIDEAYAVFCQMSGRPEKKGSDLFSLKFAMVGGIGLVVFLAIAFFLFSPAKQSERPADVPRSEVPPTAPSANTVTPPSATQTAQQPPAAPQVSDAGPDMSAEKTAAWAIDSVKRSHALGKTVTVDALMQKWTSENASTLVPVGWAAKKADDNRFLVSYTASSGSSTTGFYFDISTESGEIRDIARYPDLQQKYGIKGN